VTVLLLSACASSAYTYVTSASTHAYFRVPGDWTMYNKQQLLVASGLKNSPATEKGFPFLIGYDSAPTPSVRHVIGGIATAPVVLAEVRTLSAVDRDQASLALLRNSVYQVDQLLQADEAEILSDRDITLSNGVHGSQLVFNVAIGGTFGVLEGNQILTVNQTGLLDPSTNRMYVFIVRCGSDAYSHNRTVIDQIVRSFTVKET